jgi:alkylation response protein AidB-like acyl-CoA dehydrogenase
MDFEIPKDIQDLLKDLDEFIEAEIKPLEQQDDNIRFFDHRREYARTDFENGGVPRKDWEDLLAEMRRRADKAGFLRYAVPKKYGGRDGTNLGMAIIREYLAAKGLGLHNDLQNEASIVGNFPTIKMWENYGTPGQKEEFLEGMFTGKGRVAFGLTEPKHGSDASWLETKAVRDGDDWVINGQKRFNSGLHNATHDLVFARTSGEQGRGRGISCFIVPTNSEGFSVDFMWWTFNMPTDHAEATLTDVRVPTSAMLGQEGDGLALANTFTHENRIRQAASGVGAAQYCIDESIKYANERITFGQPLSTRQAIQWPQGLRPSEMVAAAGAEDGLGARPSAPHGDQRQGGDVQLSGEQARVRRSRPRDAGPRRDWLHTPQAVRAHLPAPSAVPHNGRLRGDPDAAHRPGHVRLRSPARVDRSAVRMNRADTEKS